MHCQIDILLSFILSCIDTVNEMKKVVLRLQSWSSSYKVLALTPFYLKSHKYVSLMQCYLKSIIADKSHLMSANDRSQNTCFKMNGWIIDAHKSYIVLPYIFQLNSTVAWPNCPDIAIILKMLAGCIHLMWGCKLHKCCFGGSFQDNLNGEKKRKDNSNRAVCTSFSGINNKICFYFKCISVRILQDLCLDGGLSRAFQETELFELWRLNILSFIYVRVMTLPVQGKESMYQGVCIGKTH